MGKIYPYPGTDNPETYEWENRIADPEQQIESYIDSIVPFANSVAIDIGSGSGFHAARFAESARQVFAVEPSSKMLAQAHRRFAELPDASNLNLLATDAEQIPLQDAIADIIHSRFAYFFGPETSHVASCEPGICEAQRLLKPGGVFAVIDNDLLTGEFASFLSYAYVDDPRREQEQKDRFWRKRGFSKQIIESSWTAPTREILKQVLAMEFPAEHLEAIMDKIEDASISYHYNIYCFRRGTQ